MKRVFIVFLILLNTFSALPQEDIKNVYSGGMLIVQPGYAVTRNNHQDINDLSFGLGGIIRFYFFDFLTAGVYGGTQKTKYSSSNSESSSISLGYGGPFLGFSLRKNNFRYTVSAFVGSGSVKNLHIEKQNNNVLEEAYLYKNSTVVLSPILSVDYAMSQRLLLTLQTVCLMAKFDGDKRLINPTLQVGILFNR